MPLFIRSIVLTSALVWQLLGAAPMTHGPAPVSDNGFAGPVRVSGPVRPIEREVATHTRFAMHQVPCAGPAGSGTTTCFVAAGS